MLDEQILERTPREWAAEAARRAGIDNFSLDLMLCLPGQTERELADSVAFCAELGADHLSAYMLKIEPSTPFAAMGDTLLLPDEEAQCRLYERLCEEAEKRGWRQYEISNFARPAKECRHNLKYWNAMPYLGLGPGAHSFLDGRRFYYPYDRYFRILFPYRKKCDRTHRIARDNYHLYVIFHKEIGYLQ